MKHPFSGLYPGSELRTMTFGPSPVGTQPSQDVSDLDWLIVIGAQISLTTGVTPGTRFFGIQLGTGGNIVWAWVGQNSVPSSTIGAAQFGWGLIPEGAVNNGIQSIAIQPIAVPSPLLMRCLIQGFTVTDIVTSFQCVYLGWRH